MTVRRGHNTQKVGYAATIEVLLRNNGSVSDTARELGLARATVQYHRRKARALGVEIPDAPWNPAQGETRADSHAAQDRRRKAEQDKPLAAGNISTKAAQVRPVPPPGEVKRYILTSAVNNTHVHTEYWRNLEAFARHYDAEIMIRRLGYNLNAYRRLGADTELDGTIDGESVYYDAAVIPHICDERVQLAPGLDWAGDAPVTATAASPLAGYDTFTGEASGIFAGTKVEMRSVATMRGRGAKHIYSTGVVTQRNYTDTKTGKKADWHHVYGALLVEVDSDGDWFVRHLIGDECGVINDIGLRAKGGRVRVARNIAALTPGDIHAAKLADAVRAAIFGPGGIVDELKPRELHCHDTHDHESRSHHNTRRPFERFRLHHTERESVAAEIAKAAEFYQYVKRPWLQVYDIWSNHSAHILRYLEETDWRQDPPNMAFYLDAARQVVSAIERGEEDFNVYEWACRAAGCPDDVRFLKPDESHVVAGIECGMHGDQGPNGSRGSARNIARTGAKSNIGHSHSPAIFEGCWQAGVSAGTVDTLDMGYNSGPSSWSRTLIVTFDNGKRSMLTMQGLKWRAGRR